MTPIRWGILGLGKIAKKFAQGLQSVPDARLVAVGSRSAGKAAEFAAEFGAPHAHAGYAALAADPEVDVVYIATPHPMHHG
jgi:predicted dehydrogenase